MKTNNFFRLMLAIAVLIMSMVTVSCTDEDWPNSQQPDTENPIVSAVLNSASMSHDWQYTDGLVVDYKTCHADITLFESKTTSQDIVNQVLPFEIMWQKPERMVRSTNLFKLENRVIGNKLLSVSKTNNHLNLNTYAQNFTFNFDGFSLQFVTKNQEVEYNKSSEVVLPNCLLDSIRYNGQTEEVIETYTVNGDPYQRYEITFDFDVFRHHTDDNEQHIDKVYPKIIVDAPKNPTDEDMFNGAIPINGTEKLYLKKKIDNTTSIYTSERDVYEFWSISGKKRVTYSVDLEIKQWVDEEQDAWKVPNIEFGNPQVSSNESISSPYTKEENSGYEFVKTTSDWSYDWSYANNYQIGTYASAERAWKMYNGHRVIEMPYSKHLHNYKEYTYDEPTEKIVDSETYLSYPSVIIVSGSYNNNAYELKQNQVFLVNKSSNEPPAPVDDIKSEEILYEYDDVNGEITSKIIWHRQYLLSGTRDSTAVQVLKRSVKLDENKQFVRMNNNLSLKQTLEPQTVFQKDETDQTTGHVITTNVIRFGFDFDFFTYNIEETYQTAYTLYKGKKLYFVAPEPKISFSGSPIVNESDIISEGGTKYKRTRYNLNFKEAYDKYVTVLTSNVDIDVEQVDPKDEYVSHTVTKDFKDGISTITLHIIGTLTKRDSVITQALAHQVIMEEDKQFYRDDNVLSYLDMSTGETVKERTENGKYITQVVTENTYKFNVGNSVVKTIHETAYIMYRGERIDFISPEPVINFVGCGNGEDMGIVIGQDGKEYNRTKYPLKYKETYNKVETPYTTNFNIDVEKKEVVVTRTYWEAKDKGMQYISERQWRTYFTLYEEFSDGSKKNTPKETYINVYVTGPDKRTLEYGSNEFTYASLTPENASTANRSGGDKIQIITSEQPYTLVYTNSDGSGLSSKFNFVSETATYRDGEIEVEFMSADWANVAKTTADSYTSPFASIITKNGDSYDRYNAAFNITGTYNGHNYGAEALVDVDVIHKSEPTIDHLIDISKTKQFGRLSWSWDASGKAFVSGTIIVKNGVISFWNGGYCFTEMDTENINKELGNSLCPESSNYLIPAYINIVTSPNKHWLYTDINGKHRDEVYGTLIMKLEDVKLDEPFFGTPSETSAIYQITEKDGTVRVKVVYKDQILFNEVFAK